jgi:uncharacterized protein (TIGR00730 family)
MDRICVFCGSHKGEKPDFLDASARLGGFLADEKIGLVYGGSDVGLMGMVAESCLRNGGEVTGVIPRKLAEMDVTHPDLTELRIVDSMHERKALMAELSDGFISLPGGIGTLEETFEMMTWNQLGIQSKPVGLLNVDHYFDPLLGFLRQVVEQGFMQAGHLDMLLVDSCEKNLVDRMRNYHPATLSKWADKEGNKIAREKN